MANHFGAPVVGITSTSLYPWFGGMVGDVVMPSYVPVNLLPFTSRMMFAERLINSVILIGMKTYYKFKYEQAVSMVLYCMQTYMQHTHRPVMKNMITFFSCVTSVQDDLYLRTYNIYSHKNVNGFNRLKKSWINT